MKKKLFWGFVWLLPICLLVGAILAGKHRPGNGNNYFPPTPKTKQVIDSWRAEPFVKIEPGSDDNLRSLAGSLDFSYPPSIDARQKDQLTNSIINFLRSFSAGTYDSYTQFRFPANNFYYSKNFSNFLAKTMSIPVEMIRDNPDKVWKTYWDAKIKDRYTNYWTGLNVAKSAVLIEDVSVFTNSLDQIVKHEENVGVLKSVPCASFDNSAAKILEQNGSLKVATVHILPQTRDGDAIYPVYVRLYWSPPDNMWLPEGLVCAYARPERKISLIF